MLQPSLSIKYIVNNAAFFVKRMDMVINEKGGEVNGFFSDAAWSGY